jgi:surfeit locus 1 family protein
LLGLILVAPTFFVLVGLGTWQVERKAWKEDLIAALKARLAEPPAALPMTETWNDLAPAQDEYWRVRFTATFDYTGEALIYATASSFRPDAKGSGYWVITPARLTDGSVVMVNRGFIPEARKDRTARRFGDIAGPVEIIGALRWPDERHWYTPAADLARNVWFDRDIAAIAEAKGLSGRIAPFYVEQESPVPPGGLPQPGKLAITLRNAHLGYAVTWYGLALALVLVVATLWIKSSPAAEPAGARADGPQ